LLAGEAREHVGRHVGRIGERLIERSECFGERVAAELRRLEHVVLGAVAACDRERGRRLVVALLGKAHAEGEQRSRLRLRHVVHDEARVDAA
jgi:hypothetical protein